VDGLAVNRAAASQPPKKRHTVTSGCVKCAGACLLMAGGLWLVDCRWRVVGGGVSCVGRRVGGGILVS